MKWNEAEVAALLASKSPDWEGRLTYKPPKSSNTFSKQAGYKDRYFKLLGNLLFCLRLGPGGQAEISDPVLVLLMENFTVAADNIQELHSFTVTFRAEENNEKKHSFVTDSARSVTQWIEALQGASYQGIREKLILLQIKLRNRTGLDPLQGTNLESNPVYNLGKHPTMRTAHLAREASPVVNLCPVPVPRTKIKGKGAGFTSHLGVEHWEPEPDREEATHTEDWANKGQKVAKKPSFTSHVPTANLLDL